MTPMAKITAAFLLVSALALPVRGEEFDQGRVIAGSHAVLPWRDRPAVENRILASRLDELLPVLMEEAGIDMWLVIAREYVEDPVYFSLVPQPAHAARRTTMLVFFRGSDGFEKLSVNRYPLGEPYETGWSGGNLEEQWQGLADLIAAKDPQRIGINTSATWPFADGLTHALHQRLMGVLERGLGFSLVELLSSCPTNWKRASCRQKTWWFAGWRPVPVRNWRCTPILSGWRGR